jgi:hypothetical protein
MAMNSYGANCMVSSGREITAVMPIVNKERLHACRTLRCTSTLIYINKTYGKS